MKGGSLMHELKKQALDVVNKINQDWVNALSEAKKNNTPIDVTGLMGKYSDSITKLDQYFRDAELRIYGKKKGMFH